MPDAQVRFTPEEIQALAKSGDLPPGAFEKMHEQDAMNYLMAKYPPREYGVMDGLQDALVSGAGAAVALPSMLGGAAAGGAANALKTGAMGYMGWEGAQALGNAVGAPTWLKNILGMAAAHGMGGMGGGKGKAGPAAAETEAIAAAKPPIGTRVAPEPGMDAPGTSLSRARAANPPNLERVRPADEVGRSVGNGVKVESGPQRVKGRTGSDTANLKDQPNVVTRRSASDVKEQVSRGVGTKNGGYAQDADTNVDYNPNSPPDADLMKKLAAILGAPRR